MEEIKLIEYKFKMMDDFRNLISKPNERELNWLEKVFGRRKQTYEEIMNECIEMNILMIDYQDFLK